MSKDKIKVAISMVTYNHENFIAKAIEGVMMQKTKFSYKLFVTDDKSPDGTAKICKSFALKYPDKIEFTPFSKNKGSKENWHYTLTKCKNSEAEFIAICDGDDYWTDPNKLQMQVDFLEKNVGYGLVHTNANLLYNETQKIVPDINGFENNYFPTNLMYNELLLENGIRTLTTMFINDFENYLDLSVLPDLKKYQLGDYPLWLILSLKYKIGYIEKPTATYRVLKESASNHGKNLNKRFSFQFSVFKMKFDFIDQFGCNNDVKRTITIDYYKLKIEYGFFKRNQKLSKEFYKKLKTLVKPDFDHKLMVFGAKSFTSWYLLSSYFRIRKIIKRNFKKLFIF